jgi:regulator of protease activity HflC (stomatin/prohibitin superfamily)
MRLNNKFWAMCLLTVALLITGCTRVVPGYVGIKVNQWGSSKGVQDYPLQTGLVWYNPFSEDIYVFPTFMQNAVWDKDVSKDSPGDDSITFNSIEGAIINADIALAYSFVADKVPHIFVEFRSEPEMLTHGYMKNEINNAFNRNASTMKATDIYGEKKQELLDRVKRDLNTQLGPKGFVFDLISFHGGLRVDSSVQQRINAVLEASQRALEAETKVKQSKAEADQAIEVARGLKQSSILKAEGDSQSTRLNAEGLAESIMLKATAQAKANQILSESLTPILIQYEATRQWNGILPTFTGSGPIPFVNVASVSATK